MKSLWDSVLWLRRKNKQDKEEILTAVNAVQNLFKTSGEATASASDIVAPKTAYNGTTLITGTIADKTGTSEYAATASIDNTNKKIKMQVPADGKYGTKNYLYQSFSNIASLIGLTASKLVKNNTVLGITGNSSNMDTSGCDAAAAQILSGKKAGVKGNVVTGTMVNRAGTTVQAAAVTQDDDNTYFAVPEAAYYDKNSKIATANSNLGAKLLWTNESTGSAFKEQTISISSTFDYCIIVFVHDTSSRLEEHAIIMAPRNSTQYYSAIGSRDQIRRDVKYSDTGIFIGNGIYLPNTIMNGYLIPYKIYGINITL